MTHAQQADHWPQITALLDQAGGHISIGRMPPIEGAATLSTITRSSPVSCGARGEAFSELL